MSYKVVIEAVVKEDREAVVRDLSAAFKLSAEKVESLLASLPRVVKEGLDEVAATKFREVLSKIGLQVRLEMTELVQDDQVPDVVNETVAEAAQEAQPGFAFRVEGRPDYAFLTVQLPANATLKVEASAMATMDTNLRMKTKLRGGLGRFLTGESLFVNEFTAENVPGEIGIAPGAPGDLAHVYLREGEVIFLQNAAYVASDMRVNLETKWQGLVKGFFSGESLFLIRASGQGDLWFNTYGGLIEMDVDGEYVVDTGNIVAFTDGLDYSLEKFGGYKSLFFSGEGFVCRFRGKGRVWIQTRTTGALVSWAHWYRPVSK